MIGADLKFAAIKFSGAFCDCLKLYRAFKTDTGKSRYTPAVIRANELHLRTEYMYFIQRLVNELEAAHPDQWGDIFRDLQKAMDAQVFNNDISMLGSEWVAASLIVSATSAETGMGDLVECLYHCMRWYSDNDPVFDGNYLTALALELFNNQARESNAFMTSAKSEIAKYGPDTEIGTAAKAYTDLCALEMVDNDTMNAPAAFAYNVDAARDAFQLCTESKVFKNIESYKFEECIAKADFSAIYEAEGTVKTKLMYIIYVLSYSIRGDGWYRAAAKTIGVSTSRCSGVNISNDRWKNGANALKKHCAP